MLDILSWNIRQGGGSRRTEIIKRIRSLNPVILVLSEFRNNEAGLYLRSQLLRLGYNFQVNTSAAADKNTVLIASKLPCNTKIFPGSDENFPHAVAEAEFPAFRLFGLYLPHKKKHKLFPFLMDELAAEKPAILAGDFNTGKNYIDQKGDSFWYTSELKKLEESGYVDAFRHKHGDVKEYSWFSHGGNGYRYDHTYVHESILPIVKDCRYVHEVREVGESDHSVMILSLGNVEV